MFSWDKHKYILCVYNCYVSLGVKLELDDIGVDLELIVDVEEVDELGRNVEEEEMIIVEDENDVTWSRDEIIQLCESYTAVMFSSKR